MYNPDEKNILLQQATTTILGGIENKDNIMIQRETLPKKLIEIRACFVTLNLDNILRGCIGSLTATQPLINDVTDNAYSAAFKDPRFPALTRAEFEKIQIDISVLSNPEQMTFSNELDLLAQLNIGIDGLVLEYKHYRSTYLPSVWKSLTTPELFLNSLKQKAGLDVDFWSEQVCCYRYTTEIIN